MANMIRREERQPSTRGTQLSRGGGLDPFRMMRDLLRWDPFREMVPFALEERALANFVPQFDVKETKDAYVFCADLPGVKEGDLDISLTGNRLTISGRREEEARDESDTWYVYERSSGNFTRSFTLPEGIDAGSVGANLDNGVLTVSIKKKPEAQPKKIEVKPGAAQTTPNVKTEKAKA